MTPNAPTRVDPVLRTLSGVLGGPAGSRAGGHPWWGATRVLLATTTVVLGAGMVGRSACVPSGWSKPHQPYAELCWTELAGRSASQSGAGAPASYLGRLAERLGSVVAPAAPPALATALVLAVVLAVVALGVTRLLATADRRRPWAAGAWAAAPLLAVHWLSWDLLAAAGVALVLVAGARRSWALGVPGALLVGAFGHPLLDTRVADTGSVWLLVQQALDAGAGTALRTVVVVGTVAVALAKAYGGVRRSRSADLTDLARAGVLVVGVALIVAPSAPPEAALLLLPLAAFAVRRWRDLLVWQSCELLSWVLTGWYLGGSLAPTAGGDSGVYWLAVLLRCGGLVWLVSAAQVSGDGDPVERRRGEADAYVDLLPDAGDARP